MGWILPINLKELPMCFDVNDENFVLFFEREKDLDYCIKKSNSLLVDAYYIESEEALEEIIDFLLSVKSPSRVAIVKEINKQGLIYEERVL